VEFDCEKGGRGAKNGNSGRPLFEGTALGGEHPFLKQKTATFLVRTAQVGVAVKITAILAHLATRIRNFCGGCSGLAGEGLAGGPQQGRSGVAGRLQGTGQQRKDVKKACYLIGDLFIKPCVAHAKKRTMRLSR
jgi:hypothetical protein